MEALDKSLSFSMFIKGIATKLKNVMAKTISPEEKLALIQGEMEADMLAKKATARNIRSKMVALCDPDTDELEPIERLQAKRAQLVNLGAQTMKLEESPDRSTKLKRIASEVKVLDSSLSSLQSTYDALKESYEVALGNYKTSLSAFEHVKNNGSAILFAIKAHKEALEIRGSVDESSNVSSSFMADLQSELEKTQRDLRSDKQIDGEIKSESIDMSVLDEHADADIDEKIMSEFKSAQ